MKKIFVLLIFILPLMANAQSQKIISGKVMTVDKAPLADVKIYDLSGTLYDSTDKEGNFKIKVSDTLNFLVFEYNGLEKTEFVYSDFINVFFPVYDEYGYVDDYTLSAEEVVITSKTSKRKLRIPTKKSKVYSRALDYYEPTPQVSSGMLTAGEVNDFQKWKLWNDIAKDDFNQFVKIWQIRPLERYTVQVADTNDFPIVGAIVRLYDKQNNLLWQAKTDNTGKAELWADIFDSTENNKAKNLTISVLYQGEVYNIDKVKPFKKGINYLTIDKNYGYSDTVEIAFVIDVTGSMSDELDYLKAEVSEIISKIKLNYPKLVYRVAIVLYKDKGDDFVVKSFDFTEKINEAQDFLMQFNASGGGDYPEAVDVALKTAEQLSWSDNARTKIMFLILDAPPHETQEVKNSLKRSVFNAAANGIRIVPLTCSGIDKSTEFLLRAFALATNGTYTFLTDDSGIGAPHLKPTTDEYDVKLLRDLFVEIVKRYVDVPTIEKLQKNAQKISDTTFVQKDTVQTDTIAKDSVNYVKNFEQVIKFYPNPTNGIVKIEVLKPTIKEFFIADFTGKLLQRVEVGSLNKVYTVDISRYVNGIYFVGFFIGDRWYSSKLLLIK